MIQTFMILCLRFLEGLKFQALEGLKSKNKQTNAKQMIQTIGIVFLGTIGEMDGTLHIYCPFIQYKVVRVLRKYTRGGYDFTIFIYFSVFTQCYN